MNQEPFSGINAFLLGTSPQCTESPYWLDDLLLQRFSASIKASQAEMIIDFTEVADRHYRLRSIPVYNLSQLGINAGISAKTPVALHEIVTQCSIPYDLADVENTVYSGSRHALQLPGYARNEDPAGFFRALAEFLYYRDTPRPYQNAAFILDYLSSLLAVHFGYSVRSDGRSYIIQQLLRLDLENSTENQNEFLGSLNFCSRLFNALRNPVTQPEREDDQKQLNALDLILPPASRQELIRSLTVLRKKTLNHLGELQDRLNAMQHSQGKDLYFHYVLTVEGSGPVQFYLSKIDADGNYHGIMISENHRYRTVLSRDELNEMELDLNF